MAADADDRRRSQIPDAQAGNGPSTPMNGLFASVYAELHGLASAQLRGERASHTLQPTALVNEAFLRLVGTGLQPPASPAEERQFLALAARAMRHVLVDHARKHRAAKRGSGARRVTLHEAMFAAEPAEVDALALHDALDKLATRDARMASVVEMRFFAGLDIEAIAEILGVSDRTVDRDWRIARAWLARELQEGGGS